MHLDGFVLPAPFFTAHHLAHLLAPALRLLVAALCGAGVGLQYELRARPGGLRTHMLTAVGATAFCLASSTVNTHDPGDALRIIQGVASGVGFIGAAAVLRDRGRIRGTSTAASLWITAAIGCQAGLGSVLLSMALAVFVVLLNVGAFRFERRWRRPQNTPPEPVVDPQSTKPDASAGG